MGEKQLDSPLQKTQYLQEWCKLPIFVAAPQLIKTLTGYSDLGLNTEALMGLLRCFNDCGHALTENKDIKMVFWFKIYIDKKNVMW